MKFSVDFKYDTFHEHKLKGGAVRERSECVHLNARAGIHCFSILASRNLHSRARGHVYESEKSGVSICSTRRTRKQMKPDRSNAHVAITKAAEPKKHRIASRLRSPLALRSLSISLLEALSSGVQRVHSSKARAWRDIARLRQPTAQYALYVFVRDLEAFSFRHGIRFIFGLRLFR